MSRLRLRLSGAPAVTCLIIGASMAYTPVHGPVNATQQVAAASAHTCKHTSTITAYAQQGHGLDMGEVDWSNTIQEYRCRFTDSDGNRIRYMRANANTPGEYAQLVNVAHFRHPNPIILCGDENRAHLIDLSYYYFNDIKKISKAEYRGYRPWARAYAERRGCEIH